jgi:hypothetical protein
MLLRRGFDFDGSVGAGGTAAVGRCARLLRKGRPTDQKEDRGFEEIRNGSARSLVGGDEVVLWCCLWSVEDERAWFVSCGQKLPLLEVGWRREGWVGREEGLCAEGNGCGLEMRGCEHER